MIANTEWKKVVASLISAVVFTALCLISYFTINGMDGGFAFAFISFFLALSSVAVSALFIHRAKVMDSICSDPLPLAHWTYPEEIARASVEWEYEDYCARNQAMFIVIGGMLVVVAFIFLVLVGDGGLETGLFLLIFTALLFVVSRSAPWLERRRAMKAPHEAVITRDGVIYEGEVYPFHTFLVFWGGVMFRAEDKKGPAVLVFSFTQLVGRFIVQPFDIVVPVPDGEDERARQIVQQLGGDVSDH